MFNKKVFTKYPKEVIVHRKKYKILYHDSLENGKICGLCDNDDQLIHISESQVQDEIESTIIHEILHAIENEYKFKWSERFVLKLERAIFQTFKRNKWKIKT